MSDSRTARVSKRAIRAPPVSEGPRQSALKGRSFAVSPDGKWLAYIADDSGRSEVYVQSFPVPGRRYQVSTEGGQQPLWNPNGRELFFRNGDQVMAVDVTSTATIPAGNPNVLFEGNFTPPSNANTWDVAPDGQRFLMIQPVEPVQPATQINGVLNWFEELKQKVPVK